MAIPFDPPQHLGADLGTGVAWLHPLPEDLVPPLKPVHRDLPAPQYPLRQVPGSRRDGPRHGATVLLHVGRHGRPIGCRLDLRAHLTLQLLCADHGMDGEAGVRVEDAIESRVGVREREAVVERVGIGVVA